MSAEQEPEKEDTTVPENQVSESRGKHVYRAINCKESEVETVLNQFSSHGWAFFALLPMPKRMTCLGDWKIIFSAYIEE